MSVCILIPWRDVGCQHRTRALDHVQACYALDGWPVVIGKHSEEPWCKATATDAAVAQTNADTFVIADADVWCTGLADAVARVTAGATWAMPHRAVLRLTELATDRLVATGAADVTKLTERAYLGVEGGGCVVLSRSVYEDCPLDQRFEGWGQEDECWGMALRTLHGPPVRVTAPLVHLWHPPQRRASRSRGSHDSWQLRRRYAQARRDQLAMRRLVDEGRPAR